MMARKNGVGQIIKAGIAVVALIALACRFRVIEAALDDLGGLTRWTRNTVWPAQLTDGLIALHIINETLDIDLHHWAPVRGWKLRCHQYRTFSHSTTLESNKSELELLGQGAQGVRRPQKRGILGRPPETSRPLTPGLPLPLYGCSAPTLTVETRSSCVDHSPSGGRRGGNRVSRGRPPRQRGEGLLRTTVGPWSISRGCQQERLPRHTGRRGRKARWRRDIRAEAAHPRGWASS